MTHIFVRIRVLLLFSLPHSCAKNVSQAEEVVGGGSRWHRECFTCHTCHTRLSSTTFKEKEGEIYCDICYAKRVEVKGHELAYAGVRTADKTGSSGSSGSSSSSSSSSSPPAASTSASLPPSTTAPNFCSSCGTTYRGDDYCSQCGATMRVYTRTPADAKKFWSHFRPKRW